MIEAEIEAQLGEGLRRRLVLQDGRGEVARQNLGADEDQRGRGQQRQDPENRSLKDQPSHPGPASVARADRGAPGARARRAMSSAGDGRHDFSQALSRIMPLSMSKPPWGVWPPTLSLWASSQSRKAGMSAPPSSLSIACISQM